jgi:2-polyprenyl-6-hydroxyphenyl methylase/3-demethylubiquinone-9 3-methyltransferase
MVGKNSIQSRLSLLNYHQCNHKDEVPMPKTNSVNSIDPKEIEHFRTLAATWWDEAGPYKALHQLNPLRLAFIRDNILKHLSAEEPTTSLSGLKVLDIGCGGGLLSEPMARMGAQVKGVDATAENIQLAKLHAEEMGLDIDYEFAAAEDLKGTYDVVLAMEIVEHVADVPSFITSCAKLVRPGGLIFMSTINRTWKSYLLGIVAAEHILKWVPKGTHQWDKFVTPDELKANLNRNDVDVIDHTGVLFDPLRGTWVQSGRDGVNYMLVGKKD